MAWSQGTQVPVKNLSPYIQRALKTVKYGARDIAVKPATEVSLSVASGKGQRGFSMLVDMETGQHKTMMGSWGGANMFNPTNRVDLDDSVRPLPPGTVLIQGEMGYPRTYAWIEAHPSVMASIALAAPAADLTIPEQKVLSVYRSIKGGSRDEYIRRYFTRSTQAQIVASLVAKGVLTVNKAGAISVTTAGKNVTGLPGYYRTRKRRRTTAPKSHAAALRRARRIR